MRTDVAINGSTSSATNYITWAPSPGEIWLSDPAGVAGPVTVRLRNQRTNVGGQVTFTTDVTQAGTSELQLTLPADGTRVAFFVGGATASIADKDAAIEVIEDGSLTTLSVTQLMVRVRKNADQLSAGERDQFLSALGRFNNKGMGRFSEFRDMHNRTAYAEAHGLHGFLSWHRAYLLDFERELQDIEAAVALPYWRFDEKAPNLFTPEFMGTSSSSGAVNFASTNPLSDWKTENSQGVTRAPKFNPTTRGAYVISQALTVGLGRSYKEFAEMEADPHDPAHGSFSGLLGHPYTSPRDPLFFLLHCNVDRLWAMWQWLEKRFDITNPDTYLHQGLAGTATATTRIGHNLQDTMWPWNGLTGNGNGSTNDRPPTAPGGGLARSAIVPAPGVAPTVGEMIDWQGKLTPATRAGFDYDDVPFEP